MKLVIDATLLIAIFDERELGVPELLQKIESMGYDLIIPEGVRKETRKYEKQGLSLTAYFQQVPFTEKKIDLIVSELGLGSGETDVIAFGLYLQNKNEKYLCAIDEGKARKTAEKLGLKIIGTLGLLDTLLQKNVISKEEYIKYLRKLQNSTFRAPEKELQKRLGRISNNEGL